MGWFRFGRKKPEGSSWLARRVDGASPDERRVLNLFLDQGSRCLFLKPWEDPSVLSLIEAGILVQPSSPWRIANNDGLPFMIRDEAWRHLTALDPRPL
ncbi:hypothetical protein [Paludisphaera rhizosphaerae]|uniref:hypothetical protein n=1 Tax=Paludisphaera rhizosphaerae TaxID=2711216 RepID=UPI0013ED7053|nr:hypothetical protein [Paludisphaera rhizosphaerae]